jgi:hypothetical protein
MMKKKGRIRIRYLGERKKSDRNIMATSRRRRAGWRVFGKSSVAVQAIPAANERVDGIRDLE